jgi:hypothetical protein
MPLLLPLAALLLVVVERGVDSGEPAGEPRLMPVWCVREVCVAGIACVAVCEYSAIALQWQAITAIAHVRSYKHVMLHSCKTKLQCIA